MDDAHSVRCQAREGRSSRMLRRVLALGAVAGVIAGGWIGWQWQVTRERQAMRAWLNSHAWEVYQWGNAHVPKVRRWFGDEAIDSLAFPREATPGELQQARRLFPEAVVQSNYY